MVTLFKSNTKTTYIKYTHTHTNKLHAHPHTMPARTHTHTQSLIHYTCRHTCPHTYDQWSYCCDFTDAGPV